MCCTVDNCQSRLFAKGLCQKHYLEQSSQEWRKIACAFDGCDRNVYSKKFGLCAAHYQQHNAGKELRPLTRRIRGSAGGPCSFDGCKNTDKVRGLCQGHYLQWREEKELTPLKRTASDIYAEVSAGVQTCSPTSGCGRTLPLDQFHIAKLTRSGRHIYCKDCSRNKELFNRYGITLAQWNALFERQGNACAICHRTSTADGRWMTDHDHSCCPTAKTCGGCVRAILCHDCNITVGYIENHPNLAAVMAYVNGPVMPADQ